MPGLEASLLSKQKLYKTRLRERFDQNVLYLENSANNRIITCTKRNRIYCVKSITQNEHSYKAQAYPAESNRIQLNQGTPGSSVQKTGNALLRTPFRSQYSL